ncbi:MAG: biopolymer transporter ExbD [Kiritimatiellae bacterium]|jgi:biopolymer transport protein ExbD|nr:biopolymer transporter ExbD [Kiritimatiellia bacterium]
MARKQQENPALDMTPMIDVVFELIIFFVVSIKQEDIFSKLNANRPAPSSSPAESSDDTSVNIEIGKGRTLNGVILYNKREVRISDLDKNLREVARTSKKTPIVIKCTGDSPHKALIDVLDVCYRNKLHSISIFTL